MAVRKTEEMSQVEIGMKQPYEFKKWKKIEVPEELKIETPEIDSGWANPEDILNETRKLSKKIHQTGVETSLVEHIPYVVGSFILGNIVVIIVFVSVIKCKPRRGREAMPPLPPPVGVQR